MYLFFSEESLSKLAVLGPEESKHAIKVLRLREGDEIRITDGTGKMGIGILTNADSERCGIKITSIIRGSDLRSYCLHIGISPLASAERFEWFVEKAVEIGIDTITPLICEHTIRKTVRTNRLKKIIISAMKQSLKTKITTINDPADFREFIIKRHEEIKLIAYCGEGTVSSISRALRKDTDCLILIGPEGDFSPQEVAEAVKHGFIPVSLGNSRLRTETAGIIACHSAYFVNQ